MSDLAGIRIRSLAHHDRLDEFFWIVREFPVRSGARASRTATASLAGRGGDCRGAARLCILARMGPALSLALALALPGAESWLAPLHAEVVVEEMS